jgi:hypothetical protein
VVHHVANLLSVLFARTVAEPLTTRAVNVLQGDMEPGKGKRLKWRSQCGYDMVPLFTRCVRLFYGKKELVRRSDRGLILSEHFGYLLNALLMDFFMWQCKKDTKVRRKAQRDS